MIDLDVQLTTKVLTRLRRKKTRGLRLNFVIRELQSRKLIGKIYTKVLRQTDEHV